MTRRIIIQKIALGGLTIVLVPSVITDCKKDSSITETGNITIDLTDPSNSALNSTGGSIITQSIIVINTGSGNFVALSSICTHQSCTVGFIKADNTLQCPCHNSVYTISGNVISGPAPAPLRSYSITRTGDMLTITI